VGERKNMTDTVGVIEWQYDARRRVVGEARQVRV
jgi:hypothetical protein